MPKRPLSAGSDIEARCTRCREVTNHTVVAMVEDRVVRVQCHICDGVHNYHPPAAKPAAKQAPVRSTAPREPREPRQTRSRAEAAAAEEWEAGVRLAATAGTVPYSMAGRYRHEDLVQHPVFGVGIVKAILPPGKMEVLFQGGRKLLRCGT